MQRTRRRFAHSLVALISGMVIPSAFLFVATRFASLDRVTWAHGSTLWSGIVFGSMLAAFAVYRFKRMPLWLAAVIGPIVVLLMVIAPAIWNVVLH